MGRGHLSKPRIVLVTPYYRPVVGGLTAFVAGLSTELIRRGAEVTVLTRDGAEVPGVRRGPSSPATFVRWCRRTIREIRPDVVHCHGHWYCLAGALSPSGRPLANRVVFTVHTLPDVRFAFRLPFRWLLRRAHVITFVSEHSRTEFVQRFGARGESAIIAPGFRDSFAQAVLEAMIMAVPVIVNEGTLEDPILRGPDSGVIRCHPNAEEVFRALRRLASNPEERVRLGARARELVLREYSWLDQAERFWTVYGLSSDPVSS